MEGQQLGLGMALPDAASFDSFHRGPNHEAVDALERMLSWRSGVIFLHGAEGAGKSHLLQALARASAAQGISCAYVPLRDAGALALLEGLEERRLVCLDDVDQPEAAVPLLRLLDALRARDRACALAARAAPEALAQALPDLRTRLSAAAVFGLKRLGDADREQLLRERAAARGLDLPADVARYLVSRLPRDTRSLLTALAELDHASLSAQRRLTIPFVQQALFRGA